MACGLHAACVFGAWSVVRAWSVVARCLVLAWSVVACCLDACVDKLCRFCLCVTPCMRPWHAEFTVCWLWLQAALVARHPCVLTSKRASAAAALGMYSIASLVHYCCWCTAGAEYQQPLGKQLVSADSCRLAGRSCCVERVVVAVW